ncbi:hypothetical protein roselon_03678 [Roseibacterium elongatum DSM 19469]|uniref:Uncharacterized protein n=1 Tax=Roseicyclus elongatus DSM 19469 TaxID=1294273 RepID=W8S6M3_9RHOB|nr:hypothetical protein [Roseibacterium elongatum]AHM05917.1 hypothetical protein roselon_03678 [Roseibacterium elongatum DSM 19469]
MQQAIRTRMGRLHRLLTGGDKQVRPLCEYPPRHLWGDLGLPERQSRALRP